MYDVPEQGGRRVVVTGASSGTGPEAAKRLAGAGAEVVLAVRTPATGEQARAGIRAEHPEAELEVRRLDLADQASAREFAEGIAAGGRPVNVLVNNAGAIAIRKRRPARRTIVPPQDVRTGTEPLLYAIADPGAYHGRANGLVGPTRKVAVPRGARSDDLAARLWRTAEELTGSCLPG